MPKHIRGASTVEAILILPIAIWVGLATLQLIWIFWAQQTLHNAGHYVLRAGQVEGGDATGMNNVLATAMASTELQWYSQPIDESNSQPQDSARLATVKALLHTRVAAKLTVHSPSDTQIENYMERRFSLREHEWIDEIAVDHAVARAATLEPNATDDWLAARQLDIEIWWCLPLQVPLVAGALQSWWQLADNPAQRFCRSRELVVGQSLWPLITRRQGPMMSGYRVND